MKKKPYLKYVHIHAKCIFFECTEITEESKSVERMIDIRDGFLSRAKFFDKEECGTLVVKSRIFNPTLFTV